MEAFESPFHVYCAPQGGTVCAVTVTGSRKGSRASRARAAYRMRDSSLYEETRRSIRPVGPIRNGKMRGEHRRKPRELTPVHGMRRPPGQDLLAPPAGRLAELL